jgi:rhamnogalacturonan endolyase
MRNDRPGRFGNTSPLFLCIAIYLIGGALFAPHFPHSLLAMEFGQTGEASAQFDIDNGNFSERNEDDTPQAWGWWSRTDIGSATHLPEDGENADGAVRIVNDGPRDFAFSNSSRFHVQSGESYRVTARIQPIQGRTELAIVALSGGETLDWSIGIGGAEPTDDLEPDAWIDVVATAIIPDGCDQIYVRFVGSADVEAVIDDVVIEAWNWRQADEDRTPVEGYAYDREARVVERLNRGLVVRRLRDDGAYLSWRLFDNDSDNTEFYVERKSLDGGMRRTVIGPVTQTTDCCFTLRPYQPGLWRIICLSEGDRQTSDWVEEITANASEPLVSIPLQGADSAQKVGIADLDGDGCYEYVAKLPGDNIDPYGPYWNPSPDTYKLEAYKKNGEILWSYDLGWAIERGIWYSPYLAYDFDGDGLAEVVAKTGKGDPRDEDGRVQDGPEYLTVLDGLTGRPRTQTAWPSREGFDGERGYNYASRNQLGIAYLDGKTPCLIVGRGTYNRMKAVAYQFHNGRLEELWRWDNDGLPGICWGQGAHWMHAADVDGDGRDEVLLGSVVLDDDGSVLWATGRGHPDHFYVGDIDPVRPGLEVYYGIEPRRPFGTMCLVDAANGETIWQHEEPTIHIHSSGLCADIDASRPGWECYSGERDEPDDKWLRDAQGNVIAQCDLGGLAPRPVYWDADLQREVIRGERVLDYVGPQHEGGSVLTLHEPSQERTIAGRVIQIADCLGDWREEIITSEDGELRIYSTTIPATDRRTCLMRDPIYRIDVAHGAMGYTQVPMLSRDPSETGR